MKRLLAIAALLAALGAGCPKTVQEIPGVTEKPPAAPVVTAPTEEPEPAVEEEDLDDDRLDEALKELDAAE